MDNIFLNAVAGVIMVLGLLVGSAGMMVLTVVIVRHLGRDDGVEHPILAGLLAFIASVALTVVSAVAAFVLLSGFVRIQPQVGIAIWGLEAILVLWIFFLSLRDGRRAAAESSPAV